MLQGRRLYALVLVYILVGNIFFWGSLISWMFIVEGMLKISTTGHSTSWHLIFVLFVNMVGCWNFNSWETKPFQLIHSRCVCEWWIINSMILSLFVYSLCLFVCCICYFPYSLIRYAIIIIIKENIISSYPT